MESDVSQQILAELQKLRRFTKRGLITFLVLFATFVVAAVWQGWSREGVYADANRAMRALDYRRAIQVAEKIAAEHPQDYSLFDYLGDLYLRSGDLAKAEEAYSRSNSLNPSEELSKSIETIRNSRVPKETAHSPTPAKGGTEAMIEPTPLTSQLPQNQARSERPSQVDSPPNSSPTRNPVGTLDDAHRFVLGTWTFTGRERRVREPEGRWVKWVVREEGTLDEYMPSRTASDWGTPTTFKYEVFTGKDGVTGRPNYGIVVKRDDGSTKARGIINDDGSFHYVIINLKLGGSFGTRLWDFPLSRADTNPFSP